MLLECTNNVHKAKIHGTQAVYLNFVASDLILGLVLGLYHPPQVSIEALVILCIVCVRMVPV